MNMLKQQHKTTTGTSTILNFADKQKLDTKPLTIKMRLGSQRYKILQIPRPYIILTGLSQ